jgi:formylglycine-generating enzyme required for sulfatase activity/nucleoside phosphorylase
MAQESSVDFVIITALAEEREAVLSQLPNYRKLPARGDDPNVYYAAEVPINCPDVATAVYRVRVLSLWKMGQSQAVAVATRALDRWRPKYVILVGIAGGVAGKSSLGDVLIADNIADFESQKVSPGKRRVRWDGYPIDSFLLSAAYNFTDKQWLQQICAPRPTVGQPHVLFGPIASGDVVLEDVVLLDELREKWDKLIGVEMEAGGVALAAFQTSFRPGFFMVRGVSDLANPDKGKAEEAGWRNYACQIAAAYTIGFLKSGPVALLSRKPQRKSDKLPTRQPEKPAARKDQLIAIPAGRSWQGAVTNDPRALPNEKPGRETHSREFQIGRYPVTNRDYARFIEASGQPAPLHWSDGQMPRDLADHPVVNVNYDEAEAYCKWLSEMEGQHYRLPTETEWEKVARGSLPDRRIYVWGDQWRDNACNSLEANRGGTTAVTEFEAINRSPFGVIDLLGNAWEWTSSWYEKYPGSTHTGDKFGQKYRVVRGGSWHGKADEARISARGRYSPDTRREYLGFRVVCETSGLPEPQSQAADAHAATIPPTRATHAARHAVPQLTPAENEQTRLRKLLAEKFSQEELRTLCFDLGIDYEDLPGEGHEAKARDLIAHCKRHDRLSEVVSYIQTVRPDIKL